MGDVNLPKPKRPLVGYARLKAYIASKEKQIILCNDLPDEVWFKVFSHLDYKTVAKLGLVSRRLYDVVNRGTVWKEYCKEIWLAEQLPDKYASWRHYFNALYASLGRYVDCYREIKLIWQKIFAVLTEKHPALLSSLKPGVTEQRLNDIEERLGDKLPDDLRCSYRIYDGQSETFPVGIFGVSDFCSQNPVASKGYFLPSLGSKGVFNILHEIKDSKCRKNMPDLFVVGCQRYENGRFFIKDPYVRLYTGTIRTDFFGVILNEKKTQCFNQAPPKGSICLFNYINLSSHCVVYARSFREFLQRYADDVENYLVEDFSLLRYEFFGREILPPIGVQLLVTLRNDNLLYTDDSGGKATCSYAIKCTLHESDKETYQLKGYEINLKDMQGLPLTGDIYPQFRRRSDNKILSENSPTFLTSGYIVTRLIDYIVVEGFLSFKNLVSGLRFVVVAPAVMVQKPEIVVFRNSDQCDLNEQ